MMPMGTRRVRTQLGLTLLETAVSVVLIAVLLSILLPALSSARSHSFRERCSLNLQRIGQAYIEFARAEPNLYRLMFGGSVLPKGEHPALDQAGREAFQVLEQTLARGQQAGELIDAPLPQLTASAWSLVHGFALLSIDGHLPGPEQAPRLTDAILEIFQKGARAPSSTQQQES